jgi:protocatechuate 3,4-dioxygenase beta subunit
MPFDDEIAIYGGFGPQAGRAGIPRLAADIAGAELLTATPAIDDHADATALAIEGPYYKFNSPNRFDLREPGETGQIVELTGTILNRLRRPMAGALVDLWHASKIGAYDNAGYRYRGHLITNADGKFRFLTIKPGAYGSWPEGTGRTVHYHVIVRAPSVWPFTTQFYFPNEADNLRDDYFRSSLLMNVQLQGEGLKAHFDIVLETFKTS